MPRRNDSQMIKDALQAKDIETLKQGFADTQALIKEGFAGVHARQDLTNGKVLKANDDITKLTYKFTYNRIIWYLFTAAMVVITGLVVSLFTKPHV